MAVEDKLLQSVKTKRDATKLLEEVDIISKSLYKAGGEAVESVLKNEVRVATAEAIRESFTQKDLNKKNYLDQIIKLIQKMPNVSLILAFEPSEGAIERFYSKISESVGQQVLLDIVYEPQIIGGAVIIYKGKYRDFSFKKVFEAEFEKSRSKILEMAEARHKEPVE